MMRRRRRGMIRIEYLKLLRGMTENLSFSFNHTPCVRALQLTLQPFSVPAALVLKNKWTTLLVLVTFVGRVEPQAFSFKAVPSPSVIVR